MNLKVKKKLEKLLTSKIIKINNIDEVRNYIIKAKEEKNKIRFIAGGYSNHEVIDTNGYLIDIHNLNKILNVDLKNKTIKVETGIVIEKLLEFLATNYDLTLANQSLFIHQTIGGAIATASHGCGNKTLYSDFVLEYEIIDGQGQKHIINHDNHKEFAAISSNLGALGFVSAVTLQCVPVYILKHNRIIEKWEKIKTTYSELFFNNDHVVLMLHADSKKALIYTWNKTSVNKVTDNSLFYKYEQILIGNFSATLAYYLTDFLPSLMNKIVDLSFNSRKISDHYEYNYKTLSFVPDYLPWQFHEIEFAVDFNDFAKVIDHILKVYEVYKKNGKQSVTILTCRFNYKSENSMLCPHFDRTTAYISLSSLGKYDTNKLFYEEIENYMKLNNARPHWGKMHNYNFNDFKLLYGSNLVEFNNIRKKFDTHAIFENGYIKRCLGSINL